MKTAKAIFILLFICITLNSNNLSAQTDDGDSLINDFFDSMFDSMLLIDQYMTFQLGAKKSSFNKDNFSELSKKGYYRITNKELDSIFKNKVYRCDLYFKNNKILTEIILEFQPLKESIDLAHLKVYVANIYNSLNETFLDATMTVEKTLKGNLYNWRGLFTQIDLEVEKAEEAQLFHNQTYYRRRLIIKEIKEIKIINSSNTQNPVIGNTIKLRPLEIAEFDFPQEMSWEEAKKACSKLGKGWRLPTSEELELMFANEIKNGGFKTSEYWSSNRSNFSKTGYIVVNFKNRRTWWSEGKTKWNVRAVKSF